MSKNIAKFDRENLREVRASVEAALAPVGAKYGIAFEVGNITFGPERATTRLTVRTNVPTNAAEQEAQDRKEFARGCVLFGLKPEHYGHSFRYAGKVYTICGLKVQSPKFPVLARGANGRVYKFREDQTGLVATSPVQKIADEERRNARAARDEAAWEAKVS